MDNIDNNYIDNIPGVKKNIVEKNQIEEEEKFYTKYMKDSFYSSVFEKPIKNRDINNKVNIDKVNKADKDNLNEKVDNIDKVDKQVENEDSSKHFLIIRELKEPNTE